MKLPLTLTIVAAFALAACTKTEEAPAPAEAAVAGKEKTDEKKTDEKKLEPARYDPNLKPGKVTWDPERKKALEARGFTFDADGKPIPPKKGK